MTDPKQLTINTYNRTADKYTQRFFDDTQDEQPYLERFLDNIPKDSRILDTGCGHGWRKDFINEL